MANRYYIIPEPTQKDISRFWGRVDIKTVNECWFWKGCKDRDGYGQFKIGNKQFRANRMAYFIHYKTQPGDLLVCHNCPNGDNALCVNPSHLFLGTPKINNLDAIQKGRRLNNRTYINKAVSRKLKEYYIQTGKLPLADTVNQKLSRASLPPDKIQELFHRYITTSISQDGLGKEYGLTNTAISILLRRYFKSFLHRT